MCVYWIEYSYFIAKNIKWRFEYKILFKNGEHFIVGTHDRHVTDRGILEVGWLVARSYEIIGKLGKTFFETSQKTELFTKKYIQ